LLGSFKSDIEFATTGQDDDLKSGRLLAGNIGSLEDTFATHIHGNLVEIGEVLAAKGEERRSVCTLKSGGECSGCLLGISGADHIETRYRTQSGDGLDWLVGRSILADGP
jgi:hypothetical protein